jgi:type I restriction enzyme S subunit
MYEIKYRDKEEMKDVKNLWYESIPREWNKLRIKDYFRDISQKNYDPDAILLSLYTEFGVKKTSDIENLRGNKSQTVIEYKKVKKNDLIVNKMLAWMGAAGISNFDGVVSTAYSVYRAINNNTDSKFFHYIFRDKRFAGECFKNGWGIMLMRWTVTPERFKSINIPVPKIKEQQKISNFLDYKTSQFDSIIEKKEKLIEKLEEAKKSLISEVVTGKIKIVDGKLVKRDESEMKDSGVEWLRKIPKDWKRIYFKRCFNVKNGREIDNEVLDSENSIPVFGSGGIFKYTDKYLYDIESVLFGRKGTIGKPIYISNIKFWTVDTMYYTVFMKEFHPKFFYYQLKLFPWEKITTNTALPSVVGTDVENSITCIPKYNQMKILADILDRRVNEMNKTIDLNKKIIEELKQAKQSLISEAVTGKIDLRDWEVKGDLNE